MSRPLRHLEPERLWFATDRCFQAQFLLRPDPDCRNVVGYWLATALERCAGIELFAFVQMSNHLHMTLRDRLGELSAFLEYFLGNVAKDTNRLRGRRGAFFHDRCHAEPIIEDEALLPRIVYTLTNPAKAGLVTTWTDWPGLIAFAGDGRVQSFVRPPREGDAEDAPRPTVELSLPPVEGAPTAAEILAAVEAAEEAIAEARGGRRVLGREVVTRQSPFSAPARPKRSPRPLCHWASREALLGFRAAWERLVAAYREASGRWRRGDRTARFPDHTFAPSVFHPG